MFRNRSVIEIMVLVFTLVIGIFIIGAGTAIAIIEIRDPAVDTSRAVGGLVSIITAILGALLGMLAGKSDWLSRRPNQDEDDTKELMVITKDDGE